MIIYVQQRLTPVSGRLFPPLEKEMRALSISFTADGALNEQKIVLADEDIGRRLLTVLGNDYHSHIELSANLTGSYGELYFDCYSSRRAPLPLSPKWQPKPSKRLLNLLRK